MFIIDIKRHKFSFLLKEKDYLVEDKLDEGYLEIADNITLKYKFSNEEKKIVIQIL